MATKPDSILAQALELAHADFESTGYLFEIRTKSGKTYEGAPEENEIERAFESGVLLLMSGALIQIDSIESIRVVPAS